MVTDFLSIVPSMALLGALRRELQPPDERYPFGHSRADGNALVARIESWACQGSDDVGLAPPLDYGHAGCQVGDESKRGRSTSMM